MLKTEAEARMCWCPMGRQYEMLTPMAAGGSYVSSVASAIPMIPSPAYNRKSQGDVPACLASQCMAWRWKDPKILRELDMVTADVVDEQPRRGYCGAFGPPKEE